MCFYNNTDLDRGSDSNEIEAIRFPNLSRKSGANLLLIKTPASALGTAGTTAHPDAKASSTGLLPESTYPPIYSAFVDYTRIYKKPASRRAIQKFDRARTRGSTTTVGAQLRAFYSLTNLPFWLDQMGDIFCHIVDIGMAVMEGTCTEKPAVGIGHPFTPFTDEIAEEVEAATYKLFNKRPVNEIYLLTLNVPGTSEAAYIAVCLSAHLCAKRLIALLGEFCTITDYVCEWEISKNKVLHLHAYIHSPDAVLTLNPVETVTTTKLSKKPSNKPSLRSLLADCWIEVMREVHALTSISAFRMAGGEELPDEFIDVDITQWKWFDRSQTWSYLANPDKQKELPALKVLNGQKLPPTMWSLISPGLRTVAHEGRAKHVA